ncbi:MAG: MFS transporter [Bacteroidota bacterium]
MRYSSNFWLACVSMFLFTTSFNLILPELNAFITNLGGESQKGLIITIFTISAALSRPFSGKLSDFIGRKQVMYFGIFVCAAVSLLYPLSTSVWFFLLLRFLHGFSAGFTPTGATALITDLLPADRRGGGMGLWGTFISLGIGAGQACSFWVVRYTGMQGLFLTACALSILSSILLFAVRETLEERVSFQRSHLLVNWGDVFERNVLPSAMVMFLSASCSGIIFVMSAEMSTFLKIDNKGWFFMFYVFSTIILRLFTARLSDIIGRRQTLVLGMGILVLSMFLIATSNGLLSYTIGSVVFGLATGISSPTLFAWTADLSPESRRGVGAGTMFIAMELGVMLGSFATTFLYDNTFQSVLPTFFFGMFFAALACVYLIWHLKFKKSVT